MRLRTTLITLSIIIGLTLGYWLYGLARTMRETVNFNVMASLSGILLTFFVPLVIILPVLILKALWFPERKWPVIIFIIPLVVSLFVGSLVSEAWILWDEKRFSVEASKTNTLYSRARAWPHQICSLVFVPGKGIHATD